MSSLDLTSLANARAWLTMKGNQTADDAVLQRLISGCSAFVRNYCNREINYKQVTEIRNGKNGNCLTLREQPVLSVSSVAVIGMPALAASSGQTDGYMLDSDGNVWMVNDVFPRGVQNVTIGYATGYQTLDDEVVVPGTPYKVADESLKDFWKYDLGVKYQDTGAALTKVSGAPAVGEYAVSTSGEYTFNAADTGKVMLISYRCVPREIERAVVEMVGERYRTIARIGETSKSMAGETTSYSTKDLNDFVRSLLNPHRTVTIGE